MTLVARGEVYEDSLVGTLLEERAVEGEDRWWLVAGEEAASIDFLFDVFEVVGETVGDDDGRKVIVAESDFMRYNELVW